MAKGAFTKAMKESEVLYPHFSKTGTPMVVEATNAMGIFPIRNFMDTGTEDYAEKIGVDVQSIYTLNDTAAAVWKMLKTMQGEEDLIAAIESEYRADSGVIRQDVKNLLEEFIKGSFVNVVGE